MTSIFKKLDKHKFKMFGVIAFLIQNYRSYLVFRGADFPTFLVCFSFFFILALSFIVVGFELDRLSERV